MLADSFALLGLNGSSTVKDVKEKYWELSFKHHPDHGGDAEEFSKLVDAYREVMKFAANAPCPHCTDGVTVALDKNFKQLTAPCGLCMGTGRRG